MTSQETIQTNIKKRKIHKLSNFIFLIFLIHAGVGVGMFIGIEESSPFGVIVAAVDIVQSRFVIVIVTAVAERIDSGYGCQRAEIGNFAPCVILICADN